MVNSVDYSTDATYIPKRNLEPNSKYNYTASTFVALRTVNTKHDLQFWIDEITGIHHMEYYVHNLFTIKWYELCNVPDTYV